MAIANKTMHTQLNTLHSDLSNSKSSADYSVTGFLNRRDKIYGTFCREHTWKSWNSFTKASNSRIIWATLSQKNIFTYQIIEYIWYNFFKMIYHKTMGRFIVFNTLLVSRWCDYLLRSLESYCKRKPPRRRLFRDRKMLWPPGHDAPARASDGTSLET